MIVRDAMSKIFGRLVVALILLAAIGGSLAVFNAMKASKQDPSAPLYARESSAVRLSGVTEGEPRSAKADILALRVVRVLPDKGVISAFEPVIVEIEVTNISSEIVGVYYSGDLSTRIEVQDSHGKLVADSPIYSYLDVLSSSHSLVHGQSMRSFFIPSAVYQFKDPGSYSVRIMLLDPPGKITVEPSDLGPVVAEGTIQVSVQPFDEKRLKERCDELIEPRKLRPSALFDFPPHANMKALWSVRHNAALPALKFVAENWGEYSHAWPTAVAIRRIGTLESAALFKALKSRQDRMGQTARSAEKADLRIHSDDYFTDWTNVTSPEATVNEFLYYFRHQQWEQAEMLFNDYFRRKHAAQFKNGSLFTTLAGKSVRSILNDPRSKVLRSRKEGKFVIVDVGQESSGGPGQVGIVRLQLIGRGGEWRLSAFPGLP